MKTIGLIAGMSWESTQSYYQLINQGIKRSLGGLHSAKIVMVSVDFHEIEQRQHAGQWQALGQMLATHGKTLEAAGADFVMICTNTMHKVADIVEQEINVPLLHIADATAQLLVKDGISRVGLLGTGFTMREDFYKGRLRDKFAIDVLVPNQIQQAQVHQIIYQELCLGEIKPASKALYLEIIADLAAQGAQAVILGCTEIGLLVNQQDTLTPLYDTTAIHAQAAVIMATSDTR